MPEATVLYVVSNGETHEVDMGFAVGDDPASQRSDTILYMWRCFGDTASHGEQHKAQAQALSALAVKALREHLYPETE